ncbi:MAG TPA: 16S rRNA (cytosine(967)-C(5))-methyltransferase RsmB [Kofleriaceae bacterium]|nr:16S rRNA (cytosine(967)-C(5))-methyltransferase RsmB [Kofleriaceae bacterium]
MARAQNAREVARRVLRRVDGEGAYISLALAGELERSQLGQDDRGLATEIAYGVVRHRSRLTRALAAHAPRGLGKLSPAIRVALEAAAYQILFLDRVPAYAAVNEAVGAVRRVGGAPVAGFANRVLRALADSGEPPLPDRADLRAYLAEACSMPAWLTGELTRAIPEAEWEEAALALTAPAPLWGRIDRARIQPAELDRILAAERPGAGAEESALCRDAVRVTGVGSPDASRSFQDGLWTVQDLGAQVIARMVGARPGQRILDACAGVGGKSTHLAQIAGDGAIIDAADSSARKLDLLTDGARRLGLSSIRPLTADLLDPGADLASSYDAILLDAPCSGLGVLRRHPELKWRGGPETVAGLAALQRGLLDALWPRLRPGGVLVYSVCTFTSAEGPAQIGDLLARAPELEPVPPEPDPAVDWAAIATGEQVRTWPHRHGADAFFAARLRRR